MPKFFDDNPNTFRTGEALVLVPGFGSEVAHIDLLIGPKKFIGPTFCNTLSRQSQGCSNLLAVIAPNWAAKPDTVTFSKVFIKNEKQAVHMFGPGQTAVGNAVNDAFLAGEFDELITNPHEELCIIAGVFIHWKADKEEGILRANYTATRRAIQRAATGGPLADELEEAQKKNLWHLFAGVPEVKSETYSGITFAEVMADLRKDFAKPAATGA